MTFPITSPCSKFLRRAGNGFHESDTGSVADHGGKVGESGSHLLDRKTDRLRERCKLTRQLQQSSCPGGSAPTHQKGVKYSEF
ncbi:methylmalonyl-CoA epimerase [Anopheles sinensis]|uniref:Methylmalonyl-CoA epimerase n=1 Tax=Anopheles sinensis TaxID=74873 RepID=A0A084WDT3_ANOSI|nr:methylmalonyl-CoA epimerase [Anopheles sinensis]